MELKKMDLIRQGDVLLVPVREIPADAKPVKRRRGRLILAEGEVTGHHHAIAEPDVELLETKAHEVFLSVMAAPALLVHEEHATLTIPPGTYRVVRQREYQPRELPRNVAD